MNVLAGDHAVGESVDTRRNDDQNGKTLEANRIGFRLISRIGLEKRQWWVQFLSPSAYRHGQSQLKNT